MRESYSALVIEKKNVIKPDITVISYKRFGISGFTKLQYSDKYAEIIVGPIPHRTDGKGDYSSAIVAMDSEEGYPPVYRIDKISNNSFRTTIKKMLEENILAA